MAFEMKNENNVVKHRLENVYFITGTAYAGKARCRAGEAVDGVISTAALDRFCEKTALYSCNAARFKSIVASVEARCVPPAKIADKCAKITAKSKPKFAYSINRNPLLLLLNLLPKRLQLFAIRMILK